MSTDSNMKTPQIKGDFEVISNSYCLPNSVLLHRSRRHGQAKFSFCDMQEGKIIRDFKTSTSHNRRIPLSHGLSGDGTLEGTIFVAATKTQEMKLWNAYTGKVLKNILAYDGYIQDLDSSADASYIFSTGAREKGRQPKYLTCWDVEKSSPSGEYRIPEYEVYSCKMAQKNNHAFVLASREKGRKEILSVDFRKKRHTVAADPCKEKGRRLNVIRDFNIGDFVVEEASQTIVYTSKVSENKRKVTEWDMRMKKIRRESKEYDDAYSTGNQLSITDAGDWAFTGNIRIQLKNPENTIRISTLPGCEEIVASQCFRYCKSVVTIDPTGANSFTNGTSTQEHIEEAIHFGPKKSSIPQKSDIERLSSSTSRASKEKISKALRRDKGNGGIVTISDFMHADSMLRRLQEDASQKSTEQKLVYLSGPDGEDIRQFLYKNVYLNVIDITTEANKLHDICCTVLKDALDHELIRSSDYNLLGHLRLANCLDSGRKELRKLTTSEYGSVMKRVEKKHKRILGPGIDKEGIVAFGAAISPVISLVFKLSTGADIPLLSIIQLIKFLKSRFGTKTQIKKIRQPEQELTCLVFSEPFFELLKEYGAEGREFQNTLKRIADNSQGSVSQLRKRLEQF